MLGERSQEGWRNGKYQERKSGLDRVVSVAGGQRRVFALCFVFLCSFLVYFLSLLSSFVSRLV